MDYCRYVNVFHGCGETTAEAPEGIARKWFFIKAQSGNTSPAAQLPFGAMSVSPYTGGYPAGYTDHLVNTHAKVARFAEGKKILGFTHLQQSGTGYIGFFYNFALVSPAYPGSERRREFSDESAVPGYYTCSIEDIKCELTADEKTALHRYTFGREGGSVSIDFSYSGLDVGEKEKGVMENLCVEVQEDGTVTAGAVTQGVNIYFAACGSGPVRIDGPRAVFGCTGNKAEIKVAISLKSCAQAQEYLTRSASFDETRKRAYSVWNDALSHIRINTGDERIKRIFYSNLYHSLIKPADRYDESFIYGDGDFMIDFATLWDMYKTAMPLICMSYGDTAVKSVNTLISLCDALGFIPNGIGISSDYVNSENQAKTLGCYVLMTAYRYGLVTDVRKMIKTICEDIFSEGKKEFHEKGKFSVSSWTLDVSDCCGLCADIAEENGDTETAEKLRKPAEYWKNCFDPATGLLSADSEYYEGTLYNYSFRQLRNMDERIALAGGKERFVSLLDSFFGYGMPDLVRPFDPADTEYIEKTMSRGVFEGFNNESDTEAPFSYIYAGRHDRTCETVRAGMKYMFTDGRGGIPGNNDSGALSSYYVFMALGLFPVAGHDLFLIGSPFVDSAEISLSSGRELRINVSGNSDSNIYVKSVKFNGVPVNDYRITAGEIMAGGILEFEMTDNKDQIQQS